MPFRVVSIRRSFALLAGFAATCLLVFALQGQAEGNPGQKCKAGAEAAGCKLPVGAEYAKDVKTGSAEGQISATVIGKGVSVTVLDAYIDCKAFDPLIGDMIGVQDSYKGSQRPKVGETYAIKKTESESSEETGSSRTDSELSLNFKSAKQLVVTLHQVSQAEGKLLCDGSKTWTLKRR
ncbi:MAG TPA: hypothetical protein VFJ57_02445 [Solirubrobacterales bacterium]|nr:hypothetical protein [Solirubrobacterales bacterium]